MAEPEDTLLGRRLAEGDGSVLDCILRAYGPRIAGWLRQKYAGKLGSQDLRDVLAAALHKLWTKRLEYDASKASLRGYFFLIARCAAADMIRARRPEILLGEMADQLLAKEPAPPPEGDPEPDEARSRLIKDLKACLDNLGESSRYILLADASSHDGIVPSETLARELNITESAVRVARKRGRDRLREDLKKLGH